MYQAKSGVKIVSLYWGGGSLDKNFFFPVWTCIKPNLVSKIFPFTGGGGGGSSTKNVFPSLNMYQAKSGVKKFSLYWDRVPPPDLDLGPPWPGPGIPPPDMDLGPPQTWEPPQTWTWDPPYLDLDLGSPLPGPGLWTPPPPKVWTDWKYNLPSSFGCGR